MRYGKAGQGGTPETVGGKIKYVRYGKEGQGRTGETVGVKIKVCDIVR